MEYLILISYLALVISDVADAIADAVKHTTNKTLHGVEVVLMRGLTSASAFVWGYVAYEGNVSFWLMAVMWLVLWMFSRLSVFNISWNLTIKAPIHNVGTTDIIDRLLSYIPDKFRLMIYGLSAFVAWCIVGVYEYLIM